MAKPIAVKQNHLIAIGRQLGFIKIFAKGAHAILLLLILDLLPRGERLQFFALAGDLGFLLADLLGLSLQDLRIASPPTRERKRKLDKSVAAVLIIASFYRFILSNPR